MIFKLAKANLLKLFQIKNCHHFKLDIIIK